MAYNDSEGRYYPRPPKRTIRKLGTAIGELRHHQFEGPDTVSVSKYNAVVDAAEVMLLAMIPQTMTREQGREYDELEDGED